ncbi:LPXTG cell wall anchor domain-containing protein [Streptococcus suis]|uniref:LPXTG cell wall anchor domain-containing protein n=1 Tax=Streptococcus suis TaxID=1307 RepID=UPI00237CDB99|nr:LPXTG cell wall anchor domain-containing protein [Streptococcus suis]MDE1692925.1 LPXTG cell wall anchor domain-containing protein [Streptococcus suis]MDE3734596.1 LPXTG cell wall anchor domain-containing protein [Streptococcus suis]
MSESLSESVSESISESVSESISESVSESISESVSESISESVSESLSESTYESISESESTPSRHSQAPRRQGVLPNTGEQSSAWTGILGAGLLLGAFYKRRKREEDKRTPLK